jgi:hypothetical protein
MVRWILLVSLVLGFWLNAGQDRANLGTPSVAAPDLQVMDGSDPFPPMPK